MAYNVWVSADQTSFGEPAREAEKRKEAAEQPSKTYTNDDLRPPSNPAAPPLVVNRSTSTIQLLEIPF